MKRGVQILISVMLCLMLSGCGAVTPSQKIKIAVMGDPETFYPGYKEGIERATIDLNTEYANTGYTVECVFYDDNGNYDEGAVIVDSISKDESIIAVLSSMNMEINQNAAYAFEKTQKLFIVPFSLYDSVYDNNYDNIFSMCYSGATIGAILHNAIIKEKPGRWAVCVGEGEFEKSEIISFMSYNNIGRVKIVDCVNVSNLSTRFNEIYDRWQTLGVEGVVILQKEKQSFDLLKKIKARNPNMMIAGDASLDNSVKIQNDEELKKLFDGIILVNEFEISEVAKDEEEKFEIYEQDYSEKTGNSIDTWYFQGYNAVRMVADTAIKNNTLSVKTISNDLHENGYKGFLQEFQFSNYGVSTEVQNLYNIFDSNGIPSTLEIK